MSEFVPPRIPLTDPRTGLIAKAWEDFLREISAQANGTIVSEGNIIFNEVYGD